MLDHKRTALSSICELSVLCQTAMPHVKQARSRTRSPRLHSAGPRQVAHRHAGTSHTQTHSTPLPLMGTHDELGNIGNICGHACMLCRAALCHPEATWSNLGLPDLSVCKRPPSSVGWTPRHLASRPPAPASPRALSRPCYPDAEMRHADAGWARSRATALHMPSSPLPGARRNACRRPPHACYAAARCRSDLCGSCSCVHT